MVLAAVMGLPRDVEVVRRAYGRGVFIPGYSRLDVRMSQ
jgi:hypothetical protein